MRLEDPQLLEHIGLTLYERKALMALMLCGVADAGTMCRTGDVPTSKIYLAMEKLAGLGLVQVQPTRPKMFAALPTDVVVNRVIEIARERSERFAADATSLNAIFAGLRTRVRGRQPFLDLALGVDGHIRRPLAVESQRFPSSPWRMSEANHFFCPFPRHHSSPPDHSNPGKQGHRLSSPDPVRGA